MTLEELRNTTRDLSQTRYNHTLVEISQRKTILLVKLDKLGINHQDGWILDEQSPQAEGVMITHPDLPRHALAFLSTDGRDTLYISLGCYGAIPTDAWDIAQEMGATL